MSYHRFTFAAILALIVTGCTSTSFVQVGEERGKEISVTKTGASKPARSIRIAQEFDDQTLTLKIKAEAVKEVVESKVRKTERFAKFEERRSCRGYCADDATISYSGFFTTHLLLIGFIMDPFMIFYQETAPTGKTKVEPLKPIEEPFEETAEQTEPLKSGTVTAEVSLPSGKTVTGSAKVVDGMASIRLDEKAFSDEVRSCKRWCEPFKSNAKIASASNEASFDLKAYAQRSEEQRASVAKQEGEKVWSKFKAAGCVVLIGEIVQKLGDGLFELQVPAGADYSRPVSCGRYHEGGCMNPVYGRAYESALLKATTKLSGVGSLRIAVQAAGTQSVTLKNGFDKKLQVYKESDRCAELVRTMQDLAH